MMAPTKWVKRPIEVSDPRAEDTGMEATQVTHKAKVRNTKTGKVGVIFDAHERGAYLSGNGKLTFLYRSMREDGTTYGPARYGDLSKFELV